MSKSKIKVMLIAFFDLQRLVHHKFVPQGHTVNQYFYKEVLSCLIARIRCSRRDLWENKRWILHHDNALAHSALSIRQFLAERQVATLEHPLYSPDLAPCDYWLFPKIKGVLKGSHFEGVEDIKEHVTSTLRSIKKEEFEGCFEA